MRVLVNNLGEPENKITGITMYAFCVLVELAKIDAHDEYIFLTTWNRPQIPKMILQQKNIRIVRCRMPKSIIINVLIQSVIVPLFFKMLRCDVIFHVTPLAAFIGTNKRVITLHDLYYEKEPRNYSKRHVTFWKWLFPHLMKKSKRIICVSDATLKELQLRYPNESAKATVVHEAPGFAIADDTSVKAANLLSGRYAVFVGNVSPNKNVTLLTAALEELVRRGTPQTVYHLGSDAAGLLQSARQVYKSANGPIPAGRLGDPEWRAAIAEAVCLINTSTDEGFCIPIVEAQALGIPVICSDIPVLREVAGEGAKYIDVKDSDGLANAIDKIFNDAEVHSFYKSRAEENSRRFSWIKAAIETRVVLEDAARS